jgi:hypothetical protein
MTMTAIRCALIDERGIYQGMTEIDESELGPQHLPTITDCDLPAGQYQWVVDAGNPYGGKFVSMRMLQAAQRLKEEVAHAMAAPNLQTLIEAAVRRRIEQILRGGSL